MKSKRLVLIMSILTVIVLTVGCLAGCSGQNLTQDKYAEAIQANNIAKDTDYKYSTIVTTDNTKDGATDQATLIKSWVFDKEHNTAQIIEIKETIKEETIDGKKKVVKTTEKTEYFFDLTEKKAVVHEYKKSSLDKKPSLDKYSDSTAIYIESVAEKVAATLSVVNYNDLKYTKGNLEVINKDANDDKKIASKYQINFKKDTLCWMYSEINVDNVKNQTVYEAFDQTVKMPKAELITA